MSIFGGSIMAGNNEQKKKNWFNFTRQIIIDWRLFITNFGCHVVGWASHSNPWIRSRSTIIHRLAVVFVKHPEDADCYSRTAIPVWQSLLFNWYVSSWKYSIISIEVSVFEMTTERWIMAGLVMCLCFWGSVLVNTNRNRNLLEQEALDYGAN